MIASFLAVSFSLLLAAAAASPANCELTAADMTANAALSFNDYDQAATLPSTGRKLVERGCFDAAAAANENYLLFGKITGERERRIVSFHLGQALALAGRNREAALVIAGTLDATQPADAGLDWNTYVVGVWAYLVKDRARLDAAQTKLAALGGNNPINARALARLQTCFTRSYQAAMNDEACAPQ